MNVLGTQESNPVDTITPQVEPTVIPDKVYEESRGKVVQPSKVETPRIGKVDIFKLPKLELQGLERQKREMMLGRRKEKLKAQRKDMNSVIGYTDITEYCKIEEKTPSSSDDVTLESKHLKNIADAAETRSRLTIKQKLSRKITEFKLRQEGFDHFVELLDIIEDTGFAKTVVRNKEGDYIEDFDYSRIDINFLKQIQNKGIDPRIMLTRLSMLNYSRYQLSDFDNDAIERLLQIGMLDEKTFNMNYQKIKAYGFLGLDEQPTNIATVDSLIGLLNAEAIPTDTINKLSSAQRIHRSTYERVPLKGILNTPNEDLGLLEMLTRSTFYRGNVNALNNARELVALFKEKGLTEDLAVFLKYKHNPSSYKFDIYNLARIPEEEREDTYNYVRKFSDYISDPDKRLWLSSHVSIDINNNDNRIDEYVLDSAIATYKYKHILESYFTLPGHQYSIVNMQFKSELVRELNELLLSDPTKANELLSFKPDEYFASYLNTIYKLGGLNLEKYEDMRGDKPGKHILADLSDIILSYHAIKDEPEDYKLQLILDIEDLGEKYVVHENTAGSRINEENEENRYKLAKKFSQVSPDTRKFILEILPTSATDLIEKDEFYTKIFNEIGLGDFDFINFLIHSTSAQELETMANSFQIIQVNKNLLTNRIKSLELETSYKVGSYNSELETLRWITELNEKEYLEFRTGFKIYEHKNINSLTNFALFFQNRDKVEELLEKINKKDYGDDESKYTSFEGFTADLWKVSSVIEILNNSNIDMALDLVSEITDEGTKISIDQLAYLSTIAKAEGFDPEKYKLAIRKFKEQFKFQSTDEFKFISNDLLLIINDISKLDETNATNWKHFTRLFEGIELNGLETKDTLPMLWKQFNKSNREEIESFLSQYDPQVIEFNLSNFCQFVNQLENGGLNKVLQLQNMSGDIGNGKINFNHLSQNTIQSISIEGLRLINSAISPEIHNKLNYISGSTYLDQISRFTDDPQNFIQYSLPFIKKLVENNIVVNLNIDPNNIKTIDPTTINSLVNIMSSLNKSAVFENKVFSNDYKDYLRLNKYFLENDIGLEDFNSVINGLNKGDIKNIPELMMYFQNVYPMDLNSYTRFVATLNDYCPAYVQSSQGRYSLVMKEGLIYNIEFLKRNKLSLNPDTKFDIASFETLNKLIDMGFDETQLVSIVNNSIEHFPLSTIGGVIDALEIKDTTQIQQLLDTVNSRLFDHYGESPSQLASILTEIIKVSGTNGSIGTIEQFSEIADVLTEFPINLNVLETNSFAVVDLIKSSPLNLRFILEQSTGSSGLININTLQQFVRANVLDINSVEDQQTYRRFVNEIGYFPSKKIFALYKSFDQKQDFTSSLEFLENVDDLEGVGSKADFTERIKLLRSNLLKTGDIDPESSLQKDILMIEGRYELGRFKRNQDAEGLNYIVDNYYRDRQEGKIVNLQNVFVAGEIEVDVIKNFRISNDSLSSMKNMLKNTKESRRLLTMNPHEIINYTTSELTEYISGEIQKLNSLQESSAHEKADNLSRVEEIFSTVDINNLLNMNELMNSIGLDSNQAILILHLLNSGNLPPDQLQLIDPVFVDKSVFNRTVSQLKKQNLITVDESGNFETSITFLHNYAINRVLTKSQNIEKQLQTKKETVFTLIETINSMNTIVSQREGLSKIFDIAGMSDEKNVNNVDTDVIVAMLSILSDYKDRASKKKISTTVLNDITQKLIWAYVLKNPHLLNLSHELGEELNILANSEIGLKHLNTLTELVNEHISSHAIESMPISEKQKEQLRKSFNINPLIQDLTNFNSAIATNKNTYNILPTRGVIAELSGDMGDACWASRSTNIMRDNPNMTAFTIVENYADPLAAKSIGSFLVIRETINGQPALILRGLNPRQDIFDQGVSGNSFLEQTLKYLSMIADNIKTQEGARNVIIVAPRSDSGAFSNRESLNSAHQNSFSGSEYHLDHTNNFNGYDITHNISIRNGDSVLEEEIVEEEAIIDNTNLYVPLLSLN